MPVENSMNIGIRPASPTQKTGNTEGVQRRGDGNGSAEAFSPKTSVSIKTAVNDMAGILAKISTNQSESVEQMPEQIQKMVQNVIKEAFSLNETLAKGLGSTLESQRFSLDQLTSLSRMLSQLGTLADKGLTAGASEKLQALLTNLKTAASAEGVSLEPVLLTKAAFELLDGKSASELPQQLQELLASLQPQGQTVSYSAASSSNLGFLKQLVEYMMPRPASTVAATASNAAPGGNINGTSAQTPGQGAPTTAQPQANIPSNNAQAGSAQTANIPTSNTQAGNTPMTNSPMANAQPGSAQPASAPLTNAQPGESMSAGSTMPPGNATSNAQVAQTASQQVVQTTSLQASGQSVAPEGGQMGQTAPNSVQTVATNGANVASNANLASSANSAQVASQPPTSQQVASQQVASQPGVSQSATGAQVASQPSASQQVAGQQLPNQSAQASLAGASVRTQLDAQPSVPLAPAQTARQAKQELMSQTIENTPAAMEAMRGAAAQIMQTSSSITEGDALLLQSFINGKEQLLNAKETRELQQLIRLCQQNIPATVQQAAQQQNLPDLPRLWAFMQLCDMAGADTRRMSARTLKKAGKDIASFVIGMRASLTGDNTTAVQGQRSLNFMMPMYMDDVTYPAYIHVYDEEKQDEITGELKKETWLRLCILTDNIGAVELTCRVYNGSQLDMRVVFSDSAAAQEFRENAAELKAELKDSTLQLNDFKIGAPGNAETV